MKRMKKRNKDQTVCQFRDDVRADSGYPHSLLLPTHSHGSSSGFTSSISFKFLVFIPSRVMYFFSLNVVCLFPKSLHATQEEDHQILPNRGGYSVLGTSNSPDGLEPHIP